MTYSEDMVCWTSEFWGEEAWVSQGLGLGGARSLARSRVTEFPVWVLELFFY